MVAAIRDSGVGRGTVRSWRKDGRPRYGQGRGAKIINY
jgi:hypothetical protein